jgi:WD40 repeat protein
MTFRSEGGSYPVFSLCFSPFNSSLLTSSGYCHINFWRIAETSDGMKMDKVTGQFGRKPISNIDAFVQLADGKVLSGTTWGSFFLWSQGLIKVEIKRRDLSLCHSGPVLHFVITEGELISTGADGWIRVWDLETIQNPESVNVEKEDRIFLLDPINEIQVGAEATLQSITKSRIKQTSDKNFWYAQDAGGGIWKVDLSFSLTMRKPERIFQCHAGGVTCLVANPTNNILLSGGVDGQLCTYNLKANILAHSVKYNAGVTCVKWLPMSLDSTGTQVLIGFADGVLRLYYMYAGGSEGKFMSLMKSLSVTMKLLQAIKPHRKPVLKISLSVDKHLAATASEEHTIFVFRLEFSGSALKLLPIGFFDFKQEIKAMDFIFNQDRISLLVGLANGQIHILDLTELPMRPIESVEIDLEQYKVKVFNIQEDLNMNGFSLFDVWFDHEGMLQIALDSDTSVELMRVQLNTLDTQDNISLQKPTKSSKITRLLKPKSKSTIICGFSDGYLQIVDVSKLKQTNLWTKAMSDAKSGRISDIVVMVEKLITSSMDGTLFVFKSKPELISDAGGVDNKPKPKKKMGWKKVPQSSASTTTSCRPLDSSCFENIHDIEDPNHLCIQDMKSKIKEETTSKMIEENMMKIQKDVSNLKRDFKKLVLKNELLPREFKIPKENFTMTEYTYREIQEQINRDIEDMKDSFKAETDKAVSFLDNLKQRYFDPIEYNRICVKGLLSKQELSTFRLVTLKDENLYSKGTEEVAIASIQQESFTPKTPRLADDTSDVVKSPSKGKAHDFLATSQYARSKTDVKISNTRILKALSKQEEKREKKLQRKREWDELNMRKPKESDEDPSLIEEIRYARENIGDFKRKTSNEFVCKYDPKPYEVALKLNDIIYLIYSKKRGFNTKVMDLQKEKKEVIEQLEIINKEIIEIQDQLSKEDCEQIPPIPDFAPEEKDLDIFLIESKEVEKIKMNLILAIEKSELGKRSVGSRRSSKVSVTMKYSKQMSNASAQPVEKRSKHSEPHLDYLEEDENFDASATYVEKSLYELSLIDIECIWAKHQQSMKIYEMTKVMHKFDDKIFEAVFDKDQLEYRLKYAELSLIFLFEEYQVIKEDNYQEAELKFNVYKQNEVLSKINVKLESVEKQLICKQENVETLKDQKRNIDEAVELELSDNKHADSLWTLYNKNPPAALTEDCYDDIALEVGLDESTGFSVKLGDVISEDDELKSKPEDLDIATFKLIRDLRNKKHEVEAKLFTERRLEDNIGRELSNLKTVSMKKERLLNEALDALNTFMKNKQKKLNQLDQLVTVNMYDLRYLDSERFIQERISTDMLLAFPEDKLSILQQRTEQLKYEKNNMKKKYKETKSTHETLINTCKVLRKDIQALDRKCKVDMEKRFGPGVTLETLESFSVNKTLEEMKETLQRKEKSYWNIQDSKAKEIKSAKDNHNERIFENSDILTEYTELQKKKYKNIHDVQKWKKLITDNDKKRMKDEEIEKELEQMMNQFKSQERKPLTSIADISLHFLTFSFRKYHQIFFCFIQFLF